jgi:hypothetical protein
MRSHRAFSISNDSEQASPLITAFLDRVGGASSSPWDVIRDLVSALEQGRSHESVDEFLTRCARLRNIVDIQDQDELGCDGFIEPIAASSISEGFRVVLRQGAPHTRRRFTLAHEICHTFFYEAAPELKLAGAHPDPFEEALCNHGAGCLLMPEAAIRESVLANCPCLDSLDRFCDLFKVSREAMVLRLRGLRLWTCEYSLWHLMTDGQFVIDKTYGRSRIGWNWEDALVLAKAWRSRRVCRGETTLWRETKSGRATRTVHYEVRRRGDIVVSLWDDCDLYEERPPLFERETEDARR